MTALNESMCREIAQAGNGVYIRVDNSGSAQSLLQKEIDKLTKSDLESTVYSNYNEQFHAIAWIILFLLIVEVLILERKNPLFKNFKLFS